MVARDAAETAPQSHSLNELHVKLGDSYPKVALYCPGWQKLENLRWVNLLATGQAEPVLSPWKRVWGQIAGFGWVEQASPIANDGAGIPRFCCWQDLTRFTCLWLSSGHDSFTLSATLDPSVEELKRSPDGYRLTIPAELRSIALRLPKGEVFFLNSTLIGRLTWRGKRRDTPKYV